MIRRYICALGAMCWLAHPAYAVLDTQLQNLQTIETDAYKMATHYFMYSVTDRSPEEQDKLNSLIAQTQTLVDQTRDSKIEAAWQGYHHAVTVNPTDSQGLVVEDTLINVQKEMKPLITAVESSIAAAHLPSNNSSGLIFQQSVLMERMTAEYLRRASDTMGGSIVANTGGNTEDPEQMAVQFTKNMDSLLHAYEGNKNVYEHLWVAYRYWNFIKGRMIDFNSKSVPYIVSIFNTNITVQLNDAYSAAN